MRQAYIYLTTNCNANCNMCYMQGYQANTIDMDYVDACHTLLILKGKQIDRITFLGGEPTLYPHLLDILRYGKSINVPFIRLQTNGNFPSSLFYNDLFLSNLDAITISLDSNSFTLNNEIRQGCDLHQTIANIKLSVQHGIRTAVNITISPENIHTILQLLEYVKSLGVRIVYLNLVFETTTYRLDNTVKSVFAHTWESLITRICKIYGQDPCIRIKAPIGYSFIDSSSFNIDTTSDDERIYIMPDMYYYNCVTRICSNIAKKNGRTDGFIICNQNADCLRCDVEKGFVVENQTITPMCIYKKVNIGKWTD